MKKDLEALRHCPLFEGVDSERLPAALDCLAAKIDRFEHQQTILAEGSPADRIGVMLSGAAQVEQVDRFGNRGIVGSLTPSDLFAESFACAGVAAIPVSVVAVGSASVLLLDRQRLLQPCANACAFHAQLIVNLTRILAAKNLAFQQKVAILSKRSTRDKLLTYLLFQAEQASSDCFEIPFDRQQLADFLAVDRSGLSSEIGKLRKLGWIDADKNRFTILPQIRAEL